MGLEKPNSGLDPGETFFPNSVSDLDSDETFQISRIVGLDIDEIVCLLDSQLCIQAAAYKNESTNSTYYRIHYAHLPSDTTPEGNWGLATSKLVK